MNLYAIIDRSLPWLLTVCVIRGRLDRLSKAIDYLNLRMNKRIYRAQLRGWELERNLADLRSPK